MPRPPPAQAGVPWREKLLGNCRGGETPGSPGSSLPRPALPAAAASWLGCRAAELPEAHALGPLLGPAALAASPCGGPAASELPAPASPPLALASLPPASRSVAGPTEASRRGGAGTGVIGGGEGVGSAGMGGGRTPQEVQDAPRFVGLANSATRWRSTDRAEQASLYAMTIFSPEVGEYGRRPLGDASLSIIAPTSTVARLARSDSVL